MTTLIISAVVLGLQLFLVLKWIGPFLMNRKKQKLFEEIGQFHNDNYEKYITELAKANPITGFDEASKSLDKYRDISILYFKGCTLQELKDAFIDLKSDFGEYLPEIKKELRNDNIDSLLEESEE